ncbi:MAG: peptidoglycan editing factor PgeF [Pseudohongiellaceae bacterium]
MTQKQKIFAQWDVSPKVVAFSTTRQGGVSKAPYASFNLGMHVGDDHLLVATNREALRRSLAPNLEWQMLDQVHSCDVVNVDVAVADITADALFTSRKNLVCCVQTADCLPVFIAALDGTEVAMVHAGWRGLASGIVENALAAMSTPADRLAIWLGPAIGPCHFEIGAEVKARFFEDAASEVTEVALEKSFKPSENPGKYMADLYAIVRLKLSALGVQAVSGGNYCTYCDESSFFSYRRDAVTGRMINAIYIEA